MIVDKKLIKVRKLVILFLCTILYFKCTNNFESTYSNKIWFGGYIIPDPLDENSIALGTEYIEVINDTSLLLYIENKIVDSIHNTELKKEFTIQQDVLTIYDDYKFTSAINQKSDSLFNFQNKTWANKEYEIQIKDSTLIIKSLREDKIVQKCYKLEKFNDFNFIRTFGSSLECNENILYFQYQIVQINEKNINLKGYFDGEFKTIKLKESHKTISNESNFNLCNDLLNNNYPFDRYYGTKVKYYGGIYNISKKFKEKYRRPNNITESGLIRVNFIVNCKGKTGMFEILELDENYKQKRFNKIISDQILSICKELNEWIPGKPEGKNVDSYKFLSFKIKNSEIIEIFP